jgi:phage tail-like protein
VSQVEERSYRFRNEDHWKAGVRRGLRVRGDRLVVPDQVCLRTLPGIGPLGANVLPAFDTRERLLWLDAESGIASRWLSEEQWAVGLGVLGGTSGAGARRLVAGRSLLWTITGGGLLRHDASTLQRFTPSLPVSGWRPSDGAGDGRDGLWVTEGDDDGNWRIRHVDCWGLTGEAPIILEECVAGDLAVSATADGHYVLAIDPDDSDVLVVVEPDEGTWRGVAVDDVHRGGRTLLAAGPEDRAYLLTVPRGFSSSSRAVVLQAVDPQSGVIEDHQVLDVPTRLGRPTALVGRSGGLALACAHGMADISAETCAESSVGTTRWATFITPALVSPRRPQAGWDRAEIEAELPLGTTMSVTWVAMDEAWSAERSAQVLDLPSTLAAPVALDHSLEWHAPATVFRGGEGPGRTHAVLLNTVTYTTLRLRIDLRVAAGSPSPALTGLRIRYPNSTYLDHLPAIYRENTRTIEDLRQLLAPYEVLLDGIDEALDELPDRISPNTASEEWIDYLLGWLGFPPLGDLPARIRGELLAQAPGLLETRGTRSGLERLLNLVTSGSATVTDSSDQPAGWFLGTGNPASAGAGPSRLGVDTVVLRQHQQPTRAGSMVLGQSRLGTACSDYQTMLARRGRTVTITVHDGVDEPVRESVLERLLDTFVPAHCRVLVRWSGPHPHPRDLLDAAFRLGSDSASEGAEETPAGSHLAGSARERLGTTTRLGRWPLPEENHLAVLDRGAHPDTGPRLL